jgi:glutathione peroxidase
MFRLYLVFLLFFSLISITVHAQEITDNQLNTCADWLDHEIDQLHYGNSIDLCAETAGKVVLLVNTASYCGYTYQFSGLEELYQRYKEQGLMLIGFPSDDFNQEDDDEAKTAEICYVNYGVNFPMTEIIKVKGHDAHSIFKHLASETAPPNWNFNKYLVDRSGQVIQLFRSGVNPDSERLIMAIEAAL